jgi:glycosyltransferase 2 family protein
MIRARSLKIAVGLAVSALGLWLAVRNAEWGEFADAAAHVDVRYVLYTALVMVLNLLVRARRWQLLVQPFAAVRWAGDALSCYCIGYLANMVLPLRPGEVLRPYLLGRKLGVEKTPMFATVLLERLWDLTCLAVLFFVAVGVSGAQVPALLRQGVLVGGILGAMALAVLWLAVGSRRFRTGIVGLIRRLPGPGGRLVHRLAELAVPGVRSLNDPLRSARVLVLTVLVWLCSYLMALFSIMAFGLDLPWHVALFVTVIANFGMMVPSSPGAIGVAHALYVGALTVFGVAPSMALAVAVVLHGVGYVVVIVAGLIALAWEGLRFAQLRESAATPPGP